ncbi:MAG: hypothetical protein FVQ82_00615 [Planctomycetes bacterium]|nr:hypothetical protein [Planctomycetota bacterium]
MRLLVISVMCVAGMFFLTSCKEKPGTGITVEDYSVTKVTGDLTDREIKRLFGKAGLTFDRFEIKLPERTGITFSSEKFKNGVSLASDLIGTMYADKGLQKFMLCKRREDRELSFSIYNSGGSIGFGSGDIEGKASTSGLIPVEKLSKTEKQPLYFFAANPRGIEGFPVENFDIETFVNKYDFAMVIYISVKE